MSILICGRRQQADKYASAKSLGEWSLAASLIADDIKDLYDIAKGGEDMQKYYWALIVIISISLLLQIIALVFALILYFKRYPGEQNTTTPPGDVEMTQPTSPPEGSQDNFGVQYGGADGGIKPPSAMQKLNDGLTMIAVLVAVFHVLKNGLKSNVLENVLESS